MDRLKRPACSPLEAFQCINGGNFTVQPANNARIMSECSRKAECQPSCTKLSYRRTVSTVPFEIWNQNGSDETLNHDKIQLDMHYEAMQVMEIRQFCSTTISQLFGIFGGLLGLWLGGSIVAIVHLATFWLTKDGEKGHVGQESSKETVWP